MLPTEHDCDVIVCDFNASLRRHMTCAAYTENVSVALQNGPFEAYLHRLLEMRRPGDRQASFALNVPDSCNQVCIACSSTYGLVSVFAARLSVTFQYMQKCELEAAAAERREPGFRAFDGDLQDIHYGHSEARGFFLSVSPGSYSHHVALCRDCHAANARPAASASADEADATDVRRSALARAVLANFFRRGSWPHELLITMPLLAVFGPDATSVFRRIPADAICNRRFPIHTLQQEVNAEAMCLLARVLPSDVITLLAARLGLYCNRAAFRRYCTALYDTGALPVDVETVHLSRGALYRASVQDAPTPRPPRRVFRLTTRSDACVCCGVPTRTDARTNELGRCILLLRPDAAVELETHHARIRLCAVCASMPQADAGHSVLHRLWLDDNFPTAVELV